MGRLMTCERDIQTVMHEAIKVFDFSVIFGKRTAEVQFELFKKGRKLLRGEWSIVDKSQVVTYKDGTEKMSRHNYEPSRAVDVVPYPIDWKDTDRMHQLRGVILAVEDRLIREGKIKKKLEWGGNWKSFKDLPHYQL